jgi:hypothetical protein
LTPFEYSIYKEEIIKTVILFVYNQLAAWRDNPFRTQLESEPDLANDLVTYLSQKAHNAEENFLFNHEEPQAGMCRVDFAAFPTGDDEDYTKKITVFECKRLPLPEKHRENEYVVGHLGGIERFKLEKHGARHDIVGMVGFIQSETISYHLVKLNGFVSNLKKGESKSILSWREDTIINTIEHCGDDLFHGMSRHQRLRLNSVLIHHLWVVL